MSDLSLLEHQFQDYLLQGKEDIYAQVIGTEKVSADCRLTIYAHAYRARLQEALMSNYSVLHAYLGDEAFETLCDAYIDAHPSNCRSIRWFGDKLASFLSTVPLHEDYPYLCELAAFEWHIGLVFDAEDAPVMLLEDMQDIPPEAWASMRLQSHPSVHRLTLYWNVVQIWQAMMDGQDPSDPMYNNTPTEWVLWRKGLETQFSSLSTDEAWAIDAIKKNVHFGELCEGLCQCRPACCLFIKRMDHRRPYI